MGNRPNHGKQIKLRRHTYSAIAILLFTAPLAFADDITWDNGASGSSALKWAIGTNWSTDSVPTAADNVIFNDIGTVSNSIALSSPSQSVNSITINTANTFSITGGTISTATINRSATSGDQTIASAISMGSAAVINVSGTGSLTLSGGLTLTSTGYSFTKNGSGELILSGSTLTTGNTADSSGNGIGDTFINEGKVTVRSNVAWKANHFTVGDGTHAATVVFNPASPAQSIQNRTIITVNKGSLLQLQNQNAGYYETLIVNEGTVDLGGVTYIAYNVNDSGSPVTPGTAAAQSITLNGGEIKNGTINLSYLATGTPILSTLASSKTSVISASLNQNGSVSPIQVADGSAAIDLDVSGQLIGNTSFKKTGAGLMRLSYDGGAAFTAGKTPTTTVSEGTLLVKNSSGSATGGGAVAVSAGATFGGSGIIRPVSYLDAQSKNVANHITLAAGSAASFATLTVGDVDTQTGQSLIGKLTVDFTSDAYEQANGKLIFGQYSKLAMQLANNQVSDQLEVLSGIVDLSATNDCLDLQSIGSNISGAYTLLTFTGTLLGKFDVVNGLGDYQLQYLDSNGTIIDVADSHYTSITGGGSIVLNAATIPEPASIGIIAIGGLALQLLRRRQR